MDCLLGKICTGRWQSSRTAANGRRGELSVQVAVDSLVELLKEWIDQIIALSRKEIADIAFSYFLLMKIHHWQILHRK